MLTEKLKNILQLYQTAIFQERYYQYIDQKADDDFKTTYDAFAQLSKNYTENVPENKLKRILKEREARISGTLLDYCVFPDLITNQMCIEIAQACNSQNPLPMLMPNLFALEFKTEDRKSEIDNITLQTLTNFLRVQDGQLFNIITVTENAIQALKKGETELDTIWTVNNIPLSPLIREIIKRRSPTLRRFVELTEQVDQPQCHDNLDPLPSKIKDELQLQNQYESPGHYLMQPIQTQHHFRNSSLALSITSFFLIAGITALITRFFLIKPLMPILIPLYFTMPVPAIIALGVACVVVLSLLCTAVPMLITKATHWKTRKNNLYRVRPENPFRKYEIYTCAEKLQKGNLPVNVKNEKEEQKPIDQVILEDYQAQSRWMFFNSQSHDSYNLQKTLHNQTLKPEQKTKALAQFIQHPNTWGTRMFCSVLETTLPKQVECRA